MGENSKLYDRDFYAWSHEQAALLRDRWPVFVDRMVKDGRYGSASEVVREGLRLMEEREAKLLALRATLGASITHGGEVTDEELDAALTIKSAELRGNGYGV